MLNKIRVESLFNRLRKTARLSLAITATLAFGAGIILSGQMLFEGEKNTRILAEYEGIATWDMEPVVAVGNPTSGRQWQYVLTPGTTENEHIGDEIKYELGAYWCADNGIAPCIPENGGVTIIDPNLESNKRIEPVPSVTWTTPEIINADLSNIPSQYKNEQGGIKCGRVQFDAGLISIDEGAGHENVEPGTILGGEVISYAPQNECVAGPSLPTCPYGSTQARVHPNSSIPWSQNITINQGESFIIGSFHNHSGDEFATDTMLTVHTPDGHNLNLNNEATVSNVIPGVYTLHVYTNGHPQDDPACSASATVTVIRAQEEPAECLRIDGPEGEIEPFAVLRYQGFHSTGEVNNIQWYLDGIPSAPVAPEFPLHFSIMAPTSGNHTIRLSINGDNIPACSKQITIAEEPQFSCVEKTADPEVLHPGDRTRYFIEYTAENVEGDGIIISDIIPEGINYVNGSAVGANDCVYQSSTRTLTCRAVTSGRLYFDAELDEDFSENEIVNTADVSYPGHQASVCNSSIQQVVYPSACLNIERDIDGPVALGTTVNYTAHIQPGDPQNLVWHVNEMPLYDENELTFSYTPENTGMDEIWLSVNHDDIQACHDILEIVEPSVICDSKTINSQSVAIGDAVTFTITYSNQTIINEPNIFAREAHLGNSYSNLRNFRVNGSPLFSCNESQFLSAGCQLPVLDGNSTSILTFDATVSNFDDLEETAVLRYGDGIESNLCSIQEPTTRQLTCQSKNVNEDFVNIGDEIEYAITVQNNGTTSLNEISVEDPLSTGLRFISSNNDECSASGNIINCHVNETFNPGSVRTFRFQVEITGDAPNGGEIENAVSRVYSQDLEGDVSACVETIFVNLPEPSVSIEKETIAPADHTMVLGDDAETTEDYVRFRITITNNGETRLTTVPLTDIFHQEDFQYISSNPAPNEILYFNEALHPFVQLNWENIGSLNPGESASVEITLMALDTYIDRNTGFLHNYAEAENIEDENGAVIDSEIGTDYVVVQGSILAIDPEVLITKELISKNPAVYGEIVRFHFRITNTGDGPAESVRFVDQYDPNYLTFIDFSSEISHVSTIYNVNGGAGIFTHENLLNGMAALQPGESVEFDIWFTAKNISGETENFAEASIGEDKSSDTAAVRIIARKLADTGADIRLPMIFGMVLAVSCVRKKSKIS